MSYSVRVPKKNGDDKSYCKPNEVELIETTEAEAKKDTG